MAVGVERLEKAIGARVAGAESREPEGPAASDRPRWSEMEGVGPCLLCGRRTDDLLRFGFPSSDRRPASRPDGTPIACYRLCRRCSRPSRTLARRIERRMGDRPHRLVPCVVG